MKLKQILNEMLVEKNIAYTTIAGKEAAVDIFENPTEEQLKESGENPRAVKTIDGKIYSVSNQDEFNIVHKDIVNILSQKKYITDKYRKNWWRKAESLNEFVCIIKERNKWFISELYGFYGLDVKSKAKDIKEKYGSMIQTKQ